MGGGDDVCVGISRLMLLRVDEVGVEGEGEGEVTTPTTTAEATYLKGNIY